MNAQTSRGRPSLARVCDLSFNISVYILVIIQDEWQKTVFVPIQEFSEPAIILFEREDFKGKKIELNAEIVNLRSLGFNTQIRSVQVIGGM